MHLIRQAWANSVDPDETPQHVAFHHGLDYLPLAQIALDTTLGSKLYFFKLLIKYDKELGFLNTKGKYGKVMDTEIKWSIKANM